jgi:3-oxoacyl-[acyl-carrier-protein] synthase-1
MREVWIAADAIISPLGLGTEENYANIRKGTNGLNLIEDESLSPIPIVAGKILDLKTSPSFFRFETISRLAIQYIIGKVSLPADRIVFILSTTKGNIGLLDQGEPQHPRIHLHEVCRFLAGTFGFKDHIVVSNACVSGVMALIVAKRFLQSGKYDHALVLGADALSHFVISGFQSLQALSNEPCRPFDAKRKGINLGEAAGAVVLTAKPDDLKVKSSIKILGGGLSNDANHISGPSRTGEELCFAIQQALYEAEVSSQEIDFISAHGTATLYNDEMEAKAFNLCGMSEIPLNSLKGYFGHTLGAAGLVETIISIHSLLHNELIPTKGFNEPGVSRAVNVIRTLESRSLSTCLKTASGFGGCNAALVLQKI